MEQSFLNQTLNSSSILIPMGFFIMSIRQKSMLFRRKKNSADAHVDTWTLS